MNKFLITLIAATAVTAPVMAEEVNMVFKTADGLTHSIGAAGLEIHFADGQMIATNTGSSISLPVETLASMEFSTDSSSVIESVNSVSGEVSVSSINGVAVGSFASLNDATNELPEGVYIIKSASGATTKIILRK